MWGELFENFCVLIAVIYALSLPLGRRPVGSSRAVRLALLTLLSLLPLLLLVFTAEFPMGAKFDLRHVPVALITLWGGPLCGVLTALPFMVYRVIHFSVSTWPSGLSMLSVILLATLVRPHFQLRERILSPALGFGRREVALVALVFSLSSFPALLVPSGQANFRLMFLPLLALNTLGFFMATLILRHHLQLLSSLHHAQNDATTDPLTGLHNRRKFEQDLRPDPEATLVLLDIDHFKTVNDQYGHPAGDRILAELARVIENTLGEHDSAYRYGGEEFALVLRGASLERTQEVITCLRQQVRQLELGEADSSISSPLTISLGVAAFRADQSPAQTVREADQLLYRAKAQGRDRAEFVCEATPELQRLAAGR